MKRILVVDDNDANIYLVRFILEKNGVEVIEARSGTEGLKLALRERPDLIILDIKLPDIDGLEATRRLRASMLDSRLPIIALTSYAMPGDKEKALAAGCTSYITKPINVATFMTEIEKYLHPAYQKEMVR